MAKKKKKAAASKQKSSDAAPREEKAAASVPAPPKYDYGILYGARQNMNEAHADVLQAELEVNSAYANQGDFAARDRDHAAAISRLNEARARASAASTEFQILKMKMKGREK